MSSVTDYLQRTVDLAAFHDQKGEGEGEVLLTQALVTVGGSGKVTTGINKLAQRWLIEFMTEVGSLQYLPTRGTSFMTQARLGYLRTTVDTEQAFSLSAFEIKENLLAEAASDTPDDELIAGARLVSMTVRGDGIILVVELKSNAGTSRKVILPIPTTV
jgi:hypothetical protein